jgi:hypothetical protein
MAAKVRRRRPRLEARDRRCRPPPMAADYFGPRSRQTTLSCLRCPSSPAQPFRASLLTNTRTDREQTRANPA